MKLIVIDLDRLKSPKKCCACTKQRFDYLWRVLNEEKVCTLTKEDFGKKTLIGLPKNDPVCLQAHKDYSDAIFKLKDDDDALKHENKMFRKLLKAKKIKDFRIGVVLKRDKAVKILGRLLGIS